MMRKLHSKMLKLEIEIEICASSNFQQLYEKLKLGTNEERKEEERELQETKERNYIKIEKLGHSYIQQLN